MRKYETTFIIDGLLAPDQREAIIEQYENSLKRLGAEMEQTVRWGMRQLAYEIKKQKHGYYVILYYSADPSILNTLHREFDLNERIFRYMTMLWDGKHPSYIRDEGAPGSADSKPVVATPVPAEKVAEEPAVAPKDEPEADTEDTEGDKAAEESKSDESDENREAE